MKSGRITRACLAAPHLTVAVMTAAHALTNIAGGDHAFGSAQLAAAALITACTIQQTKYRNRNATHQQH